MLDRELMFARAESLKESYQNADPFPHAVIDNFLPAEIAEKLVEEFPQPRSMDQKTYQTFENKIASRPDVPGFPELTKSVLYALNSGEVISFLEILTGIKGLVADPHFLGAGLQQTMPGGKLKVHVDFNFHKYLKLERRVNLLIYLNRDWRPEWGGQLELWSKDMKRCAQSITPVFNRCVVFSTSDYSYHGHPDPLRCPNGTTRKSVVLYYYSNGRDQEQPQEAYWTQHLKRPGSVRDGIGQSIEKMLLQLSPPILTQLMRRGLR